MSTIMKNTSNNSHSIQSNLVHTTKTFKLSLLGIWIILTALIIEATVANNNATHLATATIIIGVIIVLYGLLKAIITLSIAFYHIFNPPLDPQATTRIIHPAESLSPMKRKIMFKSWERNWIENEVKRLKNMS